jgi:O-antigen ligase
MKLVKWTFLIGLMVLPLVFWPKAGIKYEIPRVIWFEWWVKLLTILVVLNIKQRSKGRKDFKLVWLVWLWLIAAVITAAAGVDFSKSIWGNFYRRDGLLTLFHLVGLFLVIFISWRKSWRTPTIIALSMGMVIVSGWAVIEGVKTGGLTAIGVSFGQPNFLAGYLLAGMPFFGYLLVKSKKLWQKAVCLTALALQAAAIGLTHAKAGILGTGIAFGLWWWLKQKRYWRFAGIVLGAGLLILGVSYLGLNKKIDPRTPEDRRRIWVKVFLGAVKRPIIGYGVANVDYAFEAVDWPYPVNQGQDVYVDKAHSHLLEILATTGVIGLGVYLWLLVSVGRKLYKNKAKLWQMTLLIVLGLYVFYTQINVISIAQEVLFWLVLGVVAAES